MKKNIFFISILVVWLALSALNLIAPKKEFSEQENRYLAKFPELSFKEHVEGKLTPKIDTYINDHFIFRDKWVYLKSTLELLLGKTENNDVYIGKDGYLFEKFNNTDLNYSSIDRTIEIVNSFEKKIDNANVYSLIIPTSIYINADKLPENVVTVNQEELLKYIYDKLDTKNINVLNMLKNENKNKQLYFKTDHHLNTDGAYIVYEKMCDYMNLEFLDLNFYKRKTISNDFYGTFASKANILFTKPDIIDILENEKNVQIEKAIYDNEITNKIYNEDYLQKKDKYSYFLNGNNASTTLITNVKNGKKILLIKDSYAHIFAQFLVQNYEEIYFIDPRYNKTDISKFVNDNDIDDVLFLYNISNYVSDLGIKTIK